MEVDKGKNGKLRHSLLPLPISLFFSIQSQSPFPATIFDPRAHFPVCISVFVHFCHFSQRLTCHSADTMKGGGLFNVRGQGNMGGG